MIATELARLYLPYKNEYVNAFEQFFCSGIYIGGDRVSSFEREVAKFLDAEDAAGCGNGTHALQLGLMACGVKPGDEVITVANTYYATARAIIDVGAIPVFCDVNRFGLIDVGKIQALITPKTKAIVPVHLYGMVADITGLRDVCKKNKLALIEDCSHAFGSSFNGRKLGADAYCACFSLYPTKNLGAMGDAGVVVGAADVIKKIKLMRYYSPTVAHDSFSLLSLHSRMDPLQACLLNVSLSHIEEWNVKRIANATYYKNRFDGYVPFFTPLCQEGVVPYVFPVLTKKREDFISYMRKKGIVVQVHYGVNLHKISHITKQSFNLPMTERLNKEVVSIPVSPMITKDELRYVADMVLEYFRHKGTLR